MSLRLRHRRPTTVNGIGTSVSVSQGSSLRYMPALDGLRALAVLGIVVFHTVPSILRGGFIGVDVFFVLSGFLITAGIADQTSRGVFSFREFYLRRVQRLVPNAVLTIMVTVLLWLLILSPPAAARTAKTGFAALFSFSNVYFWRSVGGYWGDAASSVPLLNTWALAVEVQFYLIFPVVLWFLLRRPRRLLQVTLGVLIVLSFALAVVGASIDPGAAFYLFPSRAWQFLLGAVLALAWFLRAPRDSERSSNTKTWYEVGGWVGLATILAGFALISAWQQLFGLVALVPTLGALLIVLSTAKGDTSLARVLSWRPAVAMGKASYSLFLWHLPLIVLGTTYASLMGWPHYAGAFGGMALGALLSVAAYNWVEKPLRKGSPRRGARLSVAGAGFAICLVLVGTLSFSKVDYDSEDLFDQVVFRGWAYMPSSYEGDPEGGLAGRVKDSVADFLDKGARYADVDFPLNDVRPSEIWDDVGLAYDYGGTDPRVVLVGSSHAMMYAGQVDDICKELGLSVAFLMRDGEGAIPTQSMDSALASFYSERSRLIAEWRPDTVIVVDRWDSYDPASHPVELDAYVTELLSSARTVIVLTQVPGLAIGTQANVREYVSWHYKRDDSSMPAISPNRRESVRESAVAIFEEEAQRNTAFQVIRADQYFYNSDDTVRYYSGRDCYYADDDHLSEAGALQVRDALAGAIAAACSN